MKNHWINNKLLKNEFVKIELSNGELVNVQKRYHDLFVCDTSYHKQIDESICEITHNTNPIVLCYEDLYLDLSMPVLRFK